VLVSAAVLPWPPALVPELMGRAASEVEPLRHAADEALRGLVATLTRSSSRPPGRPAIGPQIVVVGPGEPGEHKGAGEVSFADFGRDVRVPPLPGASGVQAADLPTPVMVGRYLVSRVTGDSAEADRLWADARWVTVDAGEAGSLGVELREDPRDIALVLLVDGAASHGPKAPRAEDSRAGRFDDSVAAALAAGDPVQLGAIDAALGSEVGAVDVHLWSLLEAAAGRSSWEGRLLFRGEPYGVGWTVALWRRAQAAGTGLS
jgi:hypothetical protein